MPATGGRSRQVDSEGETEEALAWWAGQQQLLTCKGGAAHTLGTVPAPCPDPEPRCFGPRRWLHWGEQAWAWEGMIIMQSQGACGSAMCQQARRLHQAHLPAPPAPPCAPAACCCSRPRKKRCASPPPVIAARGGVGGWGTAMGHGFQQQTEAAAAAAAAQRSTGAAAYALPTCSVGSTATEPSGASWSAPSEAAYSAVAGRTPRHLNTCPGGLQ